MTGSVDPRYLAETRRSMQRSRADIKRIRQRIAASSLQAVSRCPERAAQIEQRDGFVFQARGAVAAGLGETDALCYTTGKEIGK